MTCICGAVDIKEVCIGSDSVMYKSNNMIIQPNLIVYKKDGIIFGILAPHNIVYYIRNTFKIPERKVETIEHYMSLSFFYSFRNIIPINIYVSALIGMENRLFYVNTYEGVTECIDGYYSIGNGSGVALGSLFSTSQYPAYKRVLLALSASENFISNVKGPFTIIGSQEHIISEHYRSPTFYNDETQEMKQLK